MQTYVFNIQNIKFTSCHYQVSWDQHPTGDDDDEQTGINMVSWYNPSHQSVSHKLRNPCLTPVHNIIHPFFASSVSSLYNFSAVIWITQIGQTVGLTSFILTVRDY